MEPSWESASRTVHDRYPEGTDGRIRFAKVRNDAGMKGPGLYTGHRGGGRGGGTITTLRALAGAESWQKCVLWFVRGREGGVT